MRSIGFLGLGHMGYSLITNLLETNSLTDYNLYVYNRDRKKSISLQDKYPFINVSNSVEDFTQNLDILISSVPAKVQKDILLQIKNNKIHYISVSNGLKISEMSKVYKGRISRIMPTVALGGYTLITKDAKDLEELFSQISTTLFIDEDEFDLFTIITSCGPGLFSVILEEITNSFSLKTSLDKTTVSQIVNKTFLGTLKQLEKESLNYNELINRVASKGGLTEVGVNILKNRLPETINSLIEKSLKFNEDLSNNIKF